jgi:iron complex outermembrane recepter protein
VKYASYKQSFKHLQDNGGAVGSLGGVYNKTTFVTVGGAPFITNDVTYTDVMPSFDVHYMMQPNWSVYGQYAVGDQIPSTTVFDVPNAKVTSTPLPTKSKTLQFGTVFKSEGFTLDADIYRTTLENPYSSSIDIATGNPVFTLNGTAVTQGIELESNIVLGNGFSLYLNQTYGSAKYDTGKWVAGAPADTKSLGLNYQAGGLDAGVFIKRIGTVYADNGATKQAFTIAPVTLANLFVNYKIAQPMAFLKSSKLQLSVNNLFNRHNIVDVAAAGTKTSSSLAPSAADVLNVLPARSVSLTLTASF